MEASQQTRAWTLTDELVLEIYTMTHRHASTAPNDLVGSLRGSAVRAAMNIIQGAQGRKEDLAPCLQAALGSLAETRYYIYLARRLGVIDVRRYRSACARHDRAVRCVRDLLAADPSGASPAVSRRPDAVWTPEFPGGEGVRRAEASVTSASGRIGTDDPG